MSAAYGQSFRLRRKTVIYEIFKAGGFYVVNHQDQFREGELRFLSAKNEQQRIARFSVLFDWFQTNSLDIVTSNPFGKSGNFEIKILKQEIKREVKLKLDTPLDIEETRNFQELAWLTVITRRRALQRASKLAACVWKPVRFF